MDRAGGDIQVQSSPNGNNTDTSPYPEPAPPLPPRLAFDSFDDLSSEALDELSAAAERQQGELQALLASVLASVRQQAELVDGAEAALRDQRAFVDLAAAALIKEGRQLREASEAKRRRADEENAAKVGTSTVGSSVPPFLRLPVGRSVGRSVGSDCYGTVKSRTRNRIFRHQQDFFYCVCTCCSNCCAKYI